VWSRNIRPWLSGSYKVVALIIYGLMVNKRKYKKYGGDYFRKRK